MNGSKFEFRRQVPKLVALAVIALAYMWVSPKPISAERRAELAARFDFEALPLPGPTGREHQPWREVHPSYETIRGWISAVGAAVSLTDLDGDGLSNDVCLVDPRTDTVSILPVPGTGDRYALQILDAAPLPYDSKTMAPMGCVPGDLNEDGRMDVIVYYWGRTPIAFLGTHEPHQAPQFQRQELCASQERWFTNALTRADVDGDGHIDIVVGNYFPDGARVLDASDTTEPQTMQSSMSRAFNAGSERILLYRESRGGADPAVEFVDTRFEVTPNMPNGWTLAIGAVDLTADGKCEIYIANDFGPDRLLHNQSEPGVLRFRLLEGVETPMTPSSCALGRDSFKGMGVDFGDVNDDGRFDIYVSNIAAEYALEESHFLFVSQPGFEAMNDGVAPYRNASEELGVARSSWGWDTRLADFDNDGVLEAVQATGFAKGDVDRWAELQELATANDALLANPKNWPKFQLGDDLCGDAPNPFYVRDGNGKFVDLAAELGLDAPQVTRGIATADVDGDGDLDFAIANQWAESTFYRNDAPSPGRSLVLDLRHGATTGELTIDPQPSELVRSYSAVGSVVRVSLPSGAVKVSHVDGGNGHSGTRSHEVHVGLGDVDPALELAVTVSFRDPAGNEGQKTINLRPGRHVILLGRGKAVQ